MDDTEAQAVNNLFRWLFRRAHPDGAPISDERFCEAALLLARHARGASSVSLGPEQIALPLGHLVESRQLALPPIAADVPLPGVITASGLLDGAATLAEASERARDFADWLLALADAGYQLEGPFLEGCGVYGMRGPAKPADGSGPESAAGSA
jgi:hypothetical protein